MAGKNDMAIWKITIMSGDQFYSDYRDDHGGFFSINWDNEYIGACSGPIMKIERVVAVPPPQST